MKKDQYVFEPSANNHQINRKNEEISMSNKNVKCNFLNIPDKFPTTASQTVNKKISQSQRDEKIPLILLHLKMT